MNPDLPTHYTAASQMPWKLFRCDQAVVAGTVRPVHLQLIPTNRCNAKCSWCSCAGDDRSTQLSGLELLQILRYFARQGTKALTVTGGGEPTLHPQLDTLLAVARELDIDTGLVTNGLLWSRMKPAQLEMANSLLTWVRMSIVDTVGPYDCDRVSRLCQNLPQVDVGLSFTVAAEVNLDTAVALCRLADDHPNLTHLRFVQDICHPVAESMDRVAEACRGLTPRAIFQYRTDHTPGATRCRVSKLKPLVGADGYVYPCCGVQYASANLRCLPNRFRMCHWTAFHRTPSFDGSVCRKCFYNDYNTTLTRLITPIQHQRFV